MKTGHTKVASLLTHDVLNLGCRLAAYSCIIACKVKERVTFTA